MEKQIDLDDIILLDDTGEESHFSHILTFMYENERYVALEPVEEGVDTDDEEEAEVVLFHITKDKDEDVYESIDNEILQNEVFDEFLRLMDEELEELPQEDR